MEDLASGVYGLITYGRVSPTHPEHPDTFIPNLLASRTSAASSGEEEEKPLPMMHAACGGWASGYGRAMKDVYRDVGDAAPRFTIKNRYILHSRVLKYTVACSTTWCRAVLHYTLLCCTVLYCTVLYFPYCTLLYVTEIDDTLRHLRYLGGTLLHFIVRQCAVLHFIVCCYASLYWTLFLYSVLK